MTRRLLPTALLLVALTGCLGKLTSSTPPRYYDVNTPFAPAGCAHPSKRSLTVWNFTASAPYDREQMIILDPKGEVRFSSEYRWVSLPGALLADQLLRDLSREGLFTKVVSPGDPFSATTHLGGHVFRFALEQSERTSRAVLEAEITVWEDRPERSLAERRILFGKTYRFESEPTEDADAAFLARSMGGLVQKLSRQLREDLCLTQP